jgi:integrase
LSGARARNVWSVLTSLMKEACTSKRRDLRVRADNPCTTVQPPDKTDAKTKTFIYPMEFLKLVSCEEVPVAWRPLYAVACYLYLRPGELRALRWSDVDFDAGVVHVTKAYDEDSQITKPPKTRNGVRDVPIPAALVTLLKVMRDRAADDGALVLASGGADELSDWKDAIHHVTGQRHVNEQPRRDTRVACRTLDERGHERGPRSRPESGPHGGIEKGDENSGDEVEQVQKAAMAPSLGLSPIAW